MEKKSANLIEVETWKVGGKVKKEKKLLKKGKDARVVMLGLDYAGKTAALYYLGMGAVISEYMKTVDANVEKVKCGKYILEFHDLGGVESLRPLWTGYYSNPLPQVIVWTVSLQDAERMEESRLSLHGVDKDLAGLNLSKKPLLVVIGSKKDLALDTNANSLVDLLAIRELQSFSQIYVQSCSTINGQGFDIVKDWICAQ